MELVKSGAYVAESFSGEKIDASKWQYWLMDTSMVVELGRGFLSIHGTTSRDERAFTALTTRRLYPADAVLITEMSMPCSYEQKGTFGFVTHLCNRLWGDQAQTPSIPDNNCEITFGRMGDMLGWFFFWFNHSEGVFHKWVKEEEPLKPLGDEGTSFRTVRLSYDLVTRELKGAILEGNRWITVGRPVRFLKLFSSIELKIDAQAKGLNLDLRFRNCRLFPNPKRNPITVFVGDPSPKVGAVVELHDLHGKLQGNSKVNSDGLAAIELPVDANFPLAGKIKVRSGQTPIDEIEIPSDNINGIYPGDFYACSKQ